MHAIQCDSVPMLLISLAGLFFQIELDTAQQQISLLAQQKELLRERMESMSDYPRLTKEKAELQGQLQLLKKQLEEAQEEKRLLHAGREWRLLSSVYQESVPIQLKT